MSDMNVRYALACRVVLWLTLERHDKLKHIGHSYIGHSYRTFQIGNDSDRGERSP
jgi:hypothetical protein